MEFIEKWGWALCGSIILFVFCLLFFLFEKHVNKTLDSLKRLNKDIEKLKKDHPHFSDQGNLLICENIDDQLIKKYKDLHPHFKHFLDSCIKDKNYYYATRRIEDYLHTITIGEIKVSFFMVYYLEVI
ncbi:MAG: hypothetical protein K2P99_01235 [Burkholderiales bacterium]|nr:hypothetical protein [Burkholderiales bacterium]